MITTERGYCNWEYTGKYETNKTGTIKKTEWKTDCGNELNLVNPYDDGETWKKRS